MDLEPLLIRIGLQTTIRACLMCPACSMVQISDPGVNRLALIRRPSVSFYSPPSPTPLLIFLFIYAMTVISVLTQMKPARGHGTQATRISASSPMSGSQPPASTKCIVAANLMPCATSGSRNSNGFSRQTSFSARVFWFFPTTAPGLVFPTACCNGCLAVRSIPLIAPSATARWCTVGVHRRALRRCAGLTGVCMCVSLYTCTLWS